VVHELAVPLPELLVVLLHVLRDPVGVEPVPDGRSREAEQGADDHSAGRDQCD
jgi:hypothetical protein